MDGPMISCVQCMYPGTYEFNVYMALYVWVSQLYCMAHYVDLCGPLHGSMWNSTWIYMALYLRDTEQCYI